MHHQVSHLRHFLVTSAQTRPIVALAAPVEFLGTIYQLDEPLVFQPSHFFKPSVSVASSQIQIKNPGKTKGDSGGNERW